MGFCNYLVNIYNWQSLSLRDSLLDRSWHNDDGGDFLHFRRPCMPTCPLWAGRSVSLFPLVCFTSKARLSRTRSLPTSGFQRTVGRRLDSLDHRTLGQDLSKPPKGRLEVAMRGNISLPFLSHLKHCVLRSPEETIYRQVFLIFYRECSTQRFSNVASKTQDLVSGEVEKDTMQEMQDKPQSNTGLGTGKWNKKKILSMGALEQLMGHGTAANSSPIYSSTEAPFRRKVCLLLITYLSPLFKEAGGIRRMKCHP